MEESIQKFVDFIYFLIDLIRGLVVSVSGKETKPAETTEDNTEAGE
jgi:hypothetical protein